jgi:hypothetical protein
LTHMAISSYYLYYLPLKASSYPTVLAPSIAV